MSDTNRRQMLLDSSKYLAGIGLTGLLGARAFADDKAAKKKLKGADLDTIEAKHPAGADSVSLKVSGHSEKIGKLLLQKLKAVSTLAILNPNVKFPPGTVQEAVSKKTKKMRSKRQEKAKTKATAEASSPAKATTLGPYAKLDVKSATVKQAPDTELTAAVRAAANDLKGPQEEAEKKAKAGEKEKEPVYTKLQFHLNSIKCIEETSELSASDEILLSGQLIQRDGTIVKLDKWKWENFDAGEARYMDYELCKSLDPKMAKAYKDVGLGCTNGSANDVYAGRKIAETKLSGPGTYSIVLIMGEEDDGGFGDMVNDLYKSVKEEIDAALMSVGVVIGAALSVYLGPLGEVIGMAIGYALTELVEWFVGLFENDDDIIKAKSWSVKFDQRTKSYVKGLATDNLPAPKNVWASPMKKLTFKGDGGHYDMRLHWRVS